MGDDQFEPRAQQGGALLGRQPPPRRPGRFGGSDRFTRRIGAQIRNLGECFPGSRIANGEMLIRIAPLTGDVGLGVRKSGRIDAMTGLQNSQANV